MYSRTFGLQGTISAVVAVAILGLSVFVLDRAHLVSAPVGSVEVGELTPLKVLALDEIVVRGKRGA
jgi:hypothetical protein